MENSEGDGYISEKIIDSFNAGTIPIYYGDFMIYEFINPKKNKLLQQKYKGVIPEYTWKNATNEKLNALKVFELRAMKKKYSGENPFLQNSFRKKQYISFTAKRENLYETFTKMSYYTDYHDIYNEIFIVIIL